MIIGVIGGSIVDDSIIALAETVGREIAKHGKMLVCGGLGGVMQAACKGARAEGGITIGILPGSETSTANPYVSVPVATGIGVARNVIIVRTADAVVAVDGSYGTLSEIAIALNLGKPVIALKSWDLPKAGKVSKDLFTVANDPHSAVQLAIQRAAQKY